MITNKALIINHTELTSIQIIREDAVKTFQDVVNRFGLDEHSYDVSVKMISPILTSFVNSRYSFVIMGDCSIDGRLTQKSFETIRSKFIDKWINKDGCTIIQAQK